MALSQEVQKKIKLLEIATKRMVNNLFLGEYRSAFKGQGMTFSEFREYVPGDEVRAISWTVTARTGKTHIKKFDEEREMTMMLVVDISASQKFGSQKFSKQEVTANLASLLSLSAARSRDPVGLLLVSDQVELYVPAKKSKGHAQRLVTELFRYEAKSKKTRLSAAAEFLSPLLKKKAHIFVISDFLDEGFDQAFRALTKKHDVVGISVQDPYEKLWPALGLVHIEDLETNERVWIDTSAGFAKQALEKYSAQQEEKKKSALRRSRIDRIDINTDADVFMPLIEFFRRRGARR